MTDFPTATELRTATHSPFAKLVDDALLTLEPLFKQAAADGHRMIVVRRLDSLAPEVKDQPRLRAFASSLIKRLQELGYRYQYQYSNVPSEEGHTFSW